MRHKSWHWDEEIQVKPLTEYTLFGVKGAILPNRPKLQFKYVRPQSCWRPQDLGCRAWMAQSPILNTFKKPLRAQGLYVSQGGSLSYGSLEDRAVLFKTWDLSEVLREPFAKVALPLPRESPGSSVFRKSPSCEVSYRPANPLSLHLLFLGGYLMTDVWEFSNSHSPPH